MPQRELVRLAPSKLLALPTELDRVPSDVPMGGTGSAASAGTLDASGTLEGTAIESEASAATTNPRPLQEGEMSATGGRHVGRHVGGIWVPDLNLRGRAPRCNGDADANVGAGLHAKSALPVGVGSHAGPPLPRTLSPPKSVQFEQVLQVATGSRPSSAETRGSQGISADLDGPQRISADLGGPRGMHELGMPGSCAPSGTAVESHCTVTTPDAHGPEPYVGAGFLPMLKSYQTQEELTFPKQYNAEKM